MRGGERQSYINLQEESLLLRNPRSGLWHLKKPGGRQAWCGSGTFLSPYTLAHHARVWDGVTADVSCSTCRKKVEQRIVREFRAEMEDSTPDDALHP